MQKLELSERLRSGTGADEMLDSEIAMHFYNRNRDGRHPPFRIPKYTSSLDAVFALVERELSTWQPSFTYIDGSNDCCVCWHLRERHAKPRVGTGIVPGGHWDVSAHCRALLLALLAAKEGK